MRNLKKILALVLALMMVLSVMVTASAASFTDSESIEYAEAVEVMAAVGALNGFENEDGTYTFNPTGALTRAQAAKILAFIMVGDLEEVALLADSIDIPFTDVASWAKDYVAYCYSEGIVNGRSATTFDANGQVTGFELGKMLLVATGHDASEYVDTVYVVNGVEYTEYLLAVLAASNTGATMETKVTAKKNWKVLVSSDLKADRIWDNEFALSKKLTREEACYLAFNAMSATLTETFGVEKVATGSLGADALGRPETCKWVNEAGQAIYTAYAAPLKVVEGATYVPATDTPSKYWNFEGCTYLYNGATGVEGWSAADLTKGGVTTEFYGTYSKATGVYTVTKAVSTEYYYAQITDVDSNKNIDLTITEAGYAINHSSAPSLKIDVNYDSTKTAAQQSANYKALAPYAKNTVLAVLVAPNWENSLTILDVKVPTEVKGTVTGSAISGAYEGYVVVGGEKLTFANEYNQKAVDIGSDGTFYMLNGLVIGFVGTRPADAATETVYVVDHFATYVPAVDPVKDAYGTVIKAGVDAYYLISAQGVNMNGEVINIPVATAASDTSATSTYTNNEKQIKKYTAQSSGLYTPGSADEVVAITVEQNKISYTNSNVNYYYDAAEYVSILGSKSDIDVSAGTKAGAISNGTAWAVYNKTTSANKTVAKIFYWNATAGDPVPENFFLYTGVNTVPEKSQITLVDGTTKVPVYTYNVYEAGEAKTIKSYEAELVADYYAYYVDQYGVAVLSDLTGVYDVVENIYGNYITVANLPDTYDNFNISGIKVVDLTTADPTNTDAANGTIEAGEYVVFYAVVRGSSVSIDCIYIVDAPAQ